MIARPILLALAVVAAIAAAGLYLLASQRLPVVFVARDLDGGRPIERADLELRGLPPDAVPLDAVRDADVVVGRSLRGPLARGQILVSAWLADHAALFQTGLVPPAGTRAVALPVASAYALGGAIVPGARVDIVAIPVTGRAAPGQRTELLAASVLVLDVRTDAGTPFARASARPGIGVISERIGSVVVAVSQSDSLRIADRIPTSTFVLVLALDE